MKHFLFVAVVAFLPLVSAAAGTESATLVRSADLHASADTGSEKVMTLDRGAELTIVERKDDAVRVSVTIPGATENAPAREASGWLPAKPVVSASMPNADEIVYGEAVDSERQAEERGGRKGAAEDAMRLYRRIADMFPNSPLAPESLWRSADINWQLQRSRGKSPLDQTRLNQVISRFPHTKWADLAAFDLLDGQLCGESNGLPDCPTKEAALYESYAREHPQSPRLGDALYNAAFRQGTVADMYRMSNQKDKAAAAHNKAVALAQELAGNAALGEWSYRAQDLMYKLQQNVPLYGVPENEP